MSELCTELSLVFHGPWVGALSLVIKVLHNLVPQYLLSFSYSTFTLCKIITNKHIRQTPSPPGPDS